MTVASDLLLQHGPRRRLFLRIAGHKYPLWEPVEDCGVYAYDYTSQWIDDFANGTKDLDHYLGDGSSGTVTETGGYMQILANANNNWIGEHKFTFACQHQPAAAPWSAITRLSYYSAGNQTMSGLTIMSAAGNGHDAWSIGWGGDAWSGWSGARVMVAHSVEGVRSVDVASNTGFAAPGTTPIWFRIDYDGTYVTLLAGTGASVDDVEWITVHGPVTCGFVPDLIGCSAENNIWNSVTSRFDLLSVDYDYERSGWAQLQCLRAPEEEWSQGLDLGTMEVAPSSIMFELDDIEDPDDPGTSYFGKLFAPGRWLAGASTRIDGDSGSLGPVHADHTTIPVQATAGFPASGEAHIGQECFSYTGVTGGGAASFTGCTRGLYPAVVGMNCAGTYHRPLEGEIAGWKPVSQYPYTMNGRMVALYVNTEDPTTGEWHSEGDAELLWVGRITGAIRYNPKKAAWQLGCESVAKDLERTVCGTTLPTPDLYKINLTGTHGREFHVTEFGMVKTVAPGGYLDPQDGAQAAYATITVDAGFYTYSELIDAVLAELQDDANWTTLNPSYPRRLSYHRVEPADPKTDLAKIMITNQWADGAGRTLWINPFAQCAAFETPPPCHVWTALGFDTVIGGFSAHCEASTGGGNRQDAILVPPNKPFVAYHPLSAPVNGGRLAVNVLGAIGPWDDQGDWGTGHPRAWVLMTGARPDGKADGQSKEIYLAQYAAISTITGTTALDLILEPPYAAYAGYIGQRFGEQAVKVEQRFIATQVLRDGTELGPFEMLLPSLLSTGTVGYNGDYDCLREGLGIGFPEELVDTDSFIAADESLAASGLTVRSQYIIDPSTTWSSLLHRECMLFGFFLCWDRGKLRLKSGSADSFSAWTVTLDESARANDREWVTPEASPDTVINTWHLRLDYDPATKKYLREITLRDPDSCEGLEITKAVELEHPGVFLGDLGEEELVDNLVDLIAVQMISKRQITRFPWQVVDITLAPPYARQVAIGDAVLYQSSRHPDPFGSGSMTTSCMGLVIDFAQSFRRWTGRAKLLLCARADTLPWAPSAVVDVTATNGGWDAANHRLTLVAHTYGTAATDSKDGAAFSAGDKATVLEFAPFDDHAAQEWTDLEVLSFDPATNLLAFVDGTDLSGWVATCEYVVVAADYTNVVVAQRARGSWQADARDRGFGNGDPAEKWG